MKELPDVMTYGDKYRPAMEMTDPQEAAEYFEVCVQHCMRHGKTRQEAEDIERKNLGYYAGYYSTETRLRVEKLFSCQHPFFGKAADGVPTSEEAFSMGKALGEKAKRGVV
jgi:hypothetical protein